MPASGPNHVYRRPLQPTGTEFAVDETGPVWLRTHPPVADRVGTLLAMEQEQAVCSGSSVRGLPGFACGMATGHVTGTDGICAGIHNRI